MYSIIIVIIACAAVFFIIKRTNPATMTNNQTNPIEVNQTVVDASSTPDVASNVLMTVTKEGSGDVVKNGDVVVVNYTGYLADGTKFDASADHGSTFRFTLGAGQVIPGWDIGLSGMKKGESRRIVIPPAYAYGAAGIPGAIPENATLTFDVDLVDINPTADTSSNSVN